MFSFLCLPFLLNFFFTGFSDGNINAVTNKLHYVHNIDKKLTDNNDGYNIHVQEETKKPTYNIFEKKENLHPLLKAATDNSKKNTLKSRREGDSLEYTNMQLELSDVSSEENDQKSLDTPKTLSTSGYKRKETYSTAFYLARDERIYINSSNVRQNKYKNIAQNRKNAMSMKKLLRKDNDNDYGQSETLRNFVQKNNFREGNPALDDINDNTSEEPKAEDSGPVYQKGIIKFEPKKGVDLYSQVTVKEPATIKKIQHRFTAVTKTKNTKNDFETSNTYYIEKDQKEQQRIYEIQQNALRQLNSDNLLRPIKPEEINRFVIEHPENSHKIVVKDANQLDMVHATGSLINRLRYKNKLCHRSFLQVEGPKYDRHGRVHVDAFVARPNEKFYVTGRPEYLLPKCCNCCKKSVLGCQ